MKYNALEKVEVNGLCKLYPTKVYKLHKGMADTYVLCGLNKRTDFLLKKSHGMITNLKHLP